MSCYHPLIGIWKGERTAAGKKKYLIEGNLDPRDCPSEYDHIMIPCGHCIGCRLDYSRSWADRMMLELETAGKGLFVTLTYRNAQAHPVVFEEFDMPDTLLPAKPHEYISDGKYYLPVGFNLSVRDCQLWMKRLRREFEGIRVRFYLAGEYGEHPVDTRFMPRPHYHVILFGIGLDDLSDLKKFGKNELGQDYYISPKMTELWNNGHVLISDVSWKTCAYVARYVTKKLNGPESITYALRNCDREFSLMSRKPGIGRDYLCMHPDCLDYETINISTAEGGLKIRIPKYYLKQLSLTDPDRYDKMMRERKELAEDSMILKLQKTTLGYLDYLEMEEQKKLNSVKALKRGKVTL